MTTHDIIDTIQPAGLTLRPGSQAPYRDIVIMQQIELPRTGSRPVMFTGEFIASFHSPNRDRADRETIARQWFVIDLYRTAAGTHVASIQYRAGAKLGRELPKDVIYTGGSLIELFDKVKVIDPAEFVTPRTGISQRATEADAERWHNTACRYAKSEFDAVINKLSRHVTKEGGPEQII